MSTERAEMLAAIRELTDAVRTLTAIMDRGSFVGESESTGIVNMPAPQMALAIRDPQAAVGRMIVKGQRRKDAEKTLGEKALLVFGYWATTFYHQTAVFDDRRKKRIIARLRENGGNHHELLFALDGAYRDDWIMGRDRKSPKKYDDIDTIFRDRAQVEKFAPHYEPGTIHPSFKDDGP